MISPYTSAAPNIGVTHPQSFSRPPIPVDSDIRRSILMQMQLAGGQLPQPHGEQSEEAGGQKEELLAPIPVLHHLEVPPEATQSVADLDL